MFSALIFVAILLIHVPNPIGGVIHFGDSLIFLAASVLPFPYGLFAAAIGPGLFNLMYAPMWLPFTVVIKPLMSLCFTSSGTKILCGRRNVLAPFVASVLGIALYFCAAVALFSLGILPAGQVGAFSAAAASLPGDMVQATGSILFFFMIARALDAARVKERLVSYQAEKTSVQSGKKL